LVFGEIEVLDWAGGFVFPVDLGTKDQLVFESMGGDLAKLVKEKQKLQAADRLNLQ